MKRMYENGIPDNYKVVIVIGPASTYYKNCTFSFISIFEDSDRRCDIK